MATSLPVQHVSNPAATPPGPTSPIATGTTGAGSRRTRSGTPGSSPTCSPSRVDERQALETLQAQYKLAIPPYYFSLIDRFDPDDPIRLQSVPSPLELAGAAGTDGEDDPLDEDKDSPVPGLTHRYPDRALLVTTHVCTMYCRFCTRKRATMKRGGWDAVSRDDRRMVEYVRDHPEIHDVIISGGDPLTLPLEKLAFFVESLTAIPHLDVIRIGTRVPVTLPQRLDDDELIDVLAASDKIWIQTHFNHPREVTPEAQRACDRLRLRGHADQQPRRPAQGGQRQPGHPARALPGPAADQGPALLPVPLRPRHRRRPLPHARLEGDRDHRGPARPHLRAWACRPTSSTLPAAAARSRSMPNYLLSASNDSVVLRNYEGMIVHYHPTGEPPERRRAGRDPGRERPARRATPRSSIPEGNPRLTRRRHRLAAGNGNGNGTNGHAQRQRQRPRRTAMATDTAKRGTAP